MNISVGRINSIQSVGHLDLYKVREIVTSNKITQTEKIKFLQENHERIKSLVEEKISGTDYEKMIDVRPLKLQNPLKNIGIKYVDWKLTAHALGIKPSEVRGYMGDIVNKLESMEDLKTLGITEDVYKTIRTHVYRMGSKKQVIINLDYELHHTENILDTLYHTLDYNSLGIANYFMFPHRRLDNKTMLKVYNVIDKNLKSCSESGRISESNALSTAEWALAKIYEIQNNQHFQNVIKLRKELG